MIPVAYKGKVVGKTVLLEQDAELPEGATVEVRLLTEPVLAPASGERQKALQRLLSMDLPVADWERLEAEIIRGAVE
jgi:hypothetical protein